MERVNCWGKNTNTDSWVFFGTVQIVLKNECVRWRKFTAAETGSHHFKETNTRPGFGSLNLRGTHKQKLWVKVNLSHAFVWLVSCECMCTCSACWWGSLWRRGGCGPLPPGCGFLFLWWQRAEVDTDPARSLFTKRPERNKTHKIQLTGAGSHHSIVVKVKQHHDTSWCF